MTRLLWFGCLLVVSGCVGKSSSSGSKSTTKKPEPPAISSQTIHTTEGSGTFNDDSPNRNPLWDLKWKAVTAEAGEKGTALVDTVSGTLYAKAKGAGSEPSTATFSADGAKVEQAIKRLTLRGNVTIVSREPKATLTCNEIVYEAPNKTNRVVKARGRVLVQFESGTLGPIDELWATPDLNKIATPGMFRE